MQIERVSKQDHIYNFEHRIEHGQQESIVVWRWNVAGGFGYRAAVYYVPCGTHIKKGLRNMRRPTPVAADLRHAPDGVSVPGKPDNSKDGASR